MYELYLNGTKVNQVWVVGEHDYSPARVATPSISYADALSDLGDCNDGLQLGYSTVDITCSTNGAAIYYRYDLCSYDQNCNAVHPDLSNVSWIAGNSVIIDYSNIGNNCEIGETYYFEAKAVKAGMLDSIIAAAEVYVSPNMTDDCPGGADCNDWESLGYRSYEECDCAENSNCGADCNDCSNWGECGYESYEDCDCQVNGNCIDCGDCNNWSECGYGSYEDCDCAENGNCE